jgi:purine-binding chemotaxis protein CheW
MMNATKQQLGDIDLDTRNDSHQFLTFILAGEEYGVDILCVQEIRGWETATELPNTPDYMLGVLNLRGTIVPIIDLRKLFHFSQIEFGLTTVIVIVKILYDGEEKTVGLVVDAISDVYNIADETIHEAPEIGSAVDIEFIKGLSTVEGKLVILLDINLLVGVGALKRVLEKMPDETPEEELPIK